jgi:hypothetical protein
VALQPTPPSEAAVIVCMETVFAALAAYVLLGERLERDRMGGRIDPGGHAPAPARNRAQRPLATGQIFRQTGSSPR